MKKQPVDKSLVIVRDVEPEEEWSFSFITSVIQAKRDLHLKSASFSLVFLTETSFVFLNMLKRNDFFVGLLYSPARAFSKAESFTSDTSHYSKTFSVRDV